MDEPSHGASFVIPPCVLEDLALLFDALSAPHDLTKLSYGGRTVVGVNLDLASGEIVGLLGPNGAGKTTTFYMTVGLTSPDAGQIAVVDDGPGCD